MVKSATRVMQILRFVGRSRDGAKHLDIATGLGIPKGSLSFLLADLVDGGFLTVDKDHRRYRIGPQVLVLAGRYLADLNLVKVSQTIIRRFIGKTNESCGLAVRTGNEVMIVWEAPSTEALKWDLKIGDQYPMYASAPGKAILAFFSGPELDRYFASVELAAVSPFTITDEAVLRKELAGIRNGDVAYSREENFVDLVSMALPVFNNEKKAVASLGVPIPKARFTQEKEGLVASALKAAATDMSCELGYY